MQQPASRPSDLERRRAGWLLGLAAVAVLARLVTAAVTHGTNDYFIWRTFGRSIAEHGLAATYAAYESFNHPPAPALWSALSWRAEELTGAAFGFVFKLAPIAADVGVMAVLWAVWRRAGAVRAAAIVAAFAWNPLSLVISGFHCNTDPVYAALALLAAYLLQERRAPLAAGLALSAAIHVKLIPVLLVAPLAATCRDRRELVRFGLGLGVGFLGYVPWLLGDAVFLERVVRYRPRSDSWGIPILLFWAFSAPGLSAAALTAARLFTAASAWTQLVGAGLVAAHARARRVAALEAATAGMTAFLVLAAGFGLQYLSAVVPLLFAVRPALASLFSVVAAAMCVTAYASAVQRTWPLEVFFTGAPVPAASRVLAVAAWAVLVVHLTWRPAPAEVNARSGSPPPAR